MGTNYRKRLIEEGRWVQPPLGRPRLDPVPVRIRELWGRLTQAEKAEFMAWANLRPAEAAEGP